MSDDNEVPSTSDDLTSDFREGQLHIVEVPRFNKIEESDGEGEETGAETETEEGALRLQLEDDDYMQLVEGASTGQGEGQGTRGQGGRVVQLDLLNLTLVRCGDGENEYRLVSNAEAESLTEGGATVTCLLQSSDGEDQDEQYIMVEGEQEVESEEAYVMLEECVRNAEGPGQGEVETAAGTGGAGKGGGTGGSWHLPVEPPPKDAGYTLVQKPTSTIEMLERAKALEKAKTLLRESMVGVRGGRAGAGRGRGRPTRRTLPSPSEILASPHFKLFLYSCKACSFQCNAMRDLSTHRKSCPAGAAAGGGAAGRGAGGAGTGAAGRLRALQCSRCLYRGYTHAQLMRHVQDSHVSTEASVEDIESLQTSEHDVLVCGGCGFESSSKPTFQRHIAIVHRATTGGTVGGVTTTTRGDGS